MQNAFTATAEVASKTDECAEPTPEFQSVHGAARISLVPDAVEIDAHRSSHVHTPPPSASNINLVTADDVLAFSAATTSLGYRVLKRAFDLAFSAVVVVVGVIPIGLVCLAISLESKGSPVYSQERMGRGGKPIRVLKLRSMYADADDVQKYLSPRQLAQWRAERKVDDDPRITKVGRIIRATSIDEIPQFLNVLTGQLSVIGPRPITLGELDQHFTPGQRRVLLSVRPGITGLWQVGERNGATFETGRRQQIELSYVHNASLALDWRIFWSTFGAMFGHRRSGR